MAHALEARKLTKVFGGAPAVDSLELSVDAGEVVGFLGPNGAGKTTTLRMLLGLLRPTSGEAMILGHRAGTAYAREHAAYVSGDVSLWPQLTGREAIAFLGSLHGSLDAAYRDRLIEIFSWIPRNVSVRIPRATDRRWRWSRPSRLAPRCCCWTSRRLVWIR